ncbi:hypothetical protein BDZ89DRAFT_1162276 [Hymenopellis radicata]|nr:hypothetical protein BDZ89DRAFT_1162276 [Hymenopellis radicata]
MDSLELFVDGISLIPHTTSTSDQMSLEIEEDTWDWDEEDTWTEWEAARPLGSPVVALGICIQFADIRGRIRSDDRHSCATDQQSHSPIQPFDLLLTDFTDFEDTIDFVLFEHDKDRFNWYVESLAAVPSNSRLHKLTLELAQLVPLKARDLGSQGAWGILDAVLSGENLQLETLIIHVYLKPSPHARTPGLAQLQTWLTEICFPAVTVKYFRCNKEETEGREMSALRLWIGDKQFDAKKH